VAGQAARDLEVDLGALERNVLEPGVAREQLGATVRPAGGQGRRRVAAGD
jgi:hypothetical protein